ncbi:transcriptional regulator, TetR family [Spongiibacter sp. IMCC21906]|jgi:AcrR family transcriptional regulator|uniref:TetR/AcrR family transcriptional regulator n=1 Tax=Spongiibacter sp. IMCC21906 TaxID=1620392 RepID=UPI00062DF203|nr:TetR/AcrR family transcriptional regulator [Spongiibacter sp. IMCC21906]AKH68251.1 transcriptional regulator, TetR family [Spongiibacter sp. IMCC21906]
MSRSDTQPRLTQAERVAISDQKMLEVATELVLELGTEKTTLKEVGERAGYSRGLASARFGCKEELFLRILKMHRELWYCVLQEYTGGREGMDAVLHRIDAVGAIIDKDPNNVKVMYTLWFDSLGHPSVLTEQLVKYNTESRNSLGQMLIQGVVNGELREDLDVPQFTIDYYSHIYGMVYQWLVSPEAVNIPRTLESLKDYCRYFLPKKKA